MRELLLLLCHYPFDPLTTDRLKELLNQVQDWKKTVDLINAHGIIALAAYNIKEAGLEREVPEDAMTILENGRRQSMVRNLWLTERWKEVNAILTNEGIKHILLKGMALEHTLYGSKGLRQMNDNDILVQPADALRAWQLLQQNGFSAEILKSPLHRRILLHIGKHLPTLYKDGYAVEIHHRLVENPASLKLRRAKVEGVEGVKKVEGVEEVEGVEKVEGPTSLKLRRADVEGLNNWFVKNSRKPQAASRTPKIVENEYFADAPEILVADTKALILSLENQLKFLVSHYEKHLLEGSCQLRLYADIILLDPNSNVIIPDQFISEPSQENKLQYRKAAYRNSIFSVDPKFRIRFLTGDIFPSLEWMKKRYGCSGVRAVLYYPQRIGKLLWLAGGH